MRRQYSKYFSNQSQEFKKVTALLVVLVVASVGTYILTGSHAATPYTSNNADQGTLACGATSKTDPTASDGKSSVVFSGSSCNGGGTGTQSCTTTISSSLAAAISSAGAGATICLNSGSYGAISLSSVSKASDVTIEPVTGATATLSSLTISSSSHLNFQSLTIGGVDLTGSSRNITIAHSAFTAGSYINLTSAVNGSNPPDVVIDSDTFDGINQPADGYEGRVQFVGTGSDVQISNSYFGDGGCSDGIQTGANGGDIGPGDEFVDLTQVCSATVHHVDPLQIYGGNNLDIHGNYFADNGTGIMAPDGGTNQTITDNVFNSPNYPPLTLGSNTNDTITHNTTNGTFRIYEGNSGQNSSKNTVENNIIGGFTINANGSSPFSTEDYNIVSGGSGAHDLKGNPTYVGGSSPSTWAGWQLTAGSVGHLAGSDGQDIGSNYFGP